MKSPICSPSKRSPLPKRQRRMRTGTEGQTPDNSTPDHTPSTCKTLAMPSVAASTMSINAFRTNDGETRSLAELQDMCTTYMVQKVASSTHSATFLDLQTHSLYHNVQESECSNVIIYYKVLHQRCDDKETLLNIVNQLYLELVAKNKKCVLLEGDQATYKRLQSIKAEYGNDLKWTVPFPGDWHILKNFQEVLIKIYYDAGLKELAIASRYQPNSVVCNFKRTHNFLLEAWESMYRHFMSLFLTNEAPSYFQEYVSNWITSFPSADTQESTFRNLKEMLSDHSEKYQDFQKD